jgi:hypothetical protein
MKTNPSRWPTALLWTWNAPIFVAWQQPLSRVKAHSETQSAPCAPSPAKRAAPNARNTLWITARNAQRPASSVLLPVAPWQDELQPMAHLIQTTLACVLSAACAAAWSQAPASPVKAQVKVLAVAADPPVGHSGLHYSANSAHLGDGAYAATVKVDERQTDRGIGTQSVVAHGAEVHHPVNQRHHARGIAKHLMPLGEGLRGSDTTLV